MTQSFEATYPNIAAWVDAYGWIEIGPDEQSSSFIKAFNEDGTVFEGDDAYANFDTALQALEAVLADWL